MEMTFRFHYLALDGAPDAPGTEILVLSPSWIKWDQLGPSAEPPIESICVWHLKSLCLPATEERLLRMPLAILALLVFTPSYCQTVRPESSRSGFGKPDQRARTDNASMMQLRCLPENPALYGTLA